MSQRILVVGDFSGRSSRAALDPGSIASRPRISVDRDDVERRMGELNVELRLDSGETLRFSELDDFEPSVFMRRLASFDALRRLDSRLRSPKTFAAAAAELAAPEPGRREPEGSGAASSDEAVPGIALPDDLLAAAIEATRRDTASGPVVQDGDDLARRLAREFVAPFLEPKADPRLDELLASVAKGMASEARTVLRDPGFVALEDAWRGLDRLVRLLETGPSLEVCLLDVSVDELRASGEAIPSLGGGGEAPRADLVVLLHRFDLGDDALFRALLARAAKDGSRLVADAHPRLAGSDGDRLAADPDEWSPVEPWPVGDALLVANRIAHRLPWGGLGASLEAFDFDELQDAGRDAIVWGSGAWAVAALFGLSGGDLGASVRLERQPVLLYRESGEVQQAPAAEVLLGDRAAAELRGRGLRALRSVRGEDVVVVGPVA